MTLENWTNGIQILSSLILAGFTIGLWKATNAQKNIAKKQHNTEIYKLKIEHLNSLIQNWLKYSKYFIEINDDIKYFAKDTTHAGQYRDFCDVIENIGALKITAQYIFNDFVASSEEELLKAIGEMHEVLKSSDYRSYLQHAYFKSQNKYNETMQLISDNISQSKKEVNNAK